MGFTDILDGTFSLYRNHFKLFFSIAAIYHVSRFGSDLLSTFFVDGRVPDTSFIKFVLSFFKYFLDSFFLGVLIYASTQSYLGRDITLRASFQRVLYRFLPCFYSWIFIFLSIVPFVVLTNMFFDPIGVGIFFVLTASLFLIYFLVRWYFYGMFILYEGSAVREALRRSAELVKGSWWRVFGIASAIYSISLMIALVLLTSCFFLFFLTGVIDEAPILVMISRMLSPPVSEVGWLSYVIVSFVVQSIVPFTTLPVWAIGPTLLYFDLRIRKEGFDIEILVHDL